MDREGERYIEDINIVRERERERTRYSKATMLIKRTRIIMMIIKMRHLIYIERDAEGQIDV